MRVDTAGGHLVGPDLRRLHEPVVDAQRGNAIFFTQGIGAVNDVLFQCIHIDGGRCILRPRQRFVGFRLCRGFTGVRFSALHLHTAVLTIPINLETNSLADVPEPHIVADVDVVRRQADFLTVYKDAVGGKCRFQRFHRLRRGSTQRKPQHETAEDEPGILQSVHRSASILNVYVEIFAARTYHRQG